MRLFLIAGRAGSGKSSVAKIIRDYYEKQKKRVVITEYSKYLKLYAKEMLLWDESSLLKPRMFLQEIGSFVRENLKDENFLVRRMLEDMRVYERFVDIVIISDIRFPNEILMMRERYSNSVSILVKNELDDYLPLKEAMHITEHALDDFEGFNYTIYNQYEKNLINDVYEILEEL